MNKIDPLKLGVQPVEYHPEAQQTSSPLSLFMPQMTNPFLGSMFNMPQIGYSYMINYPMPSFSIPSYNKDYDFSNLFKTTTPSKKKSVRNDFDFVQASGYGKMTNSQLKQIYGDYTKDATKLFTGTADDLNRYLKGKGVLQGKGQDFIDAQNKYGISASVLAAICVNESAHGRSNLSKTKNNVGGVRKSGSTEFRSFATVGDCIDYMGSFLKKGYLDKGLTQLYQINAKYCPASDRTDKTGMNSRWARAVTKFSNEIESSLNLYA